MLTDENKYAFKIHKILLEIGNEVIQLSIEKKIKQNESIRDFFRTKYNSISRNRHLIDLKRKLDYFIQTNSNQYPDNLNIFDITSKIAIARNLLNSTHSVEVWYSNNVIEMNSLNFDRCLNNLRLIRNEFFAHLINYQISETDYNRLLDQLKILIKELVLVFDTNKAAYYEQKIQEIETHLVISLDDFKEFQSVRLTTLISETYVPTDTKFFVERDHDKKILETLVDENDHDIIVLQGIGGIGKSTLAFYLVNKLLNDYDDYKFKWFDFNTDLNVEYKRILEKEYNKNCETSEDYIIMALHNELINEKKSKIIFVFDNVENFAEKKNFILKMPSSIKIIITTRNRELKIRDFPKRSKEFVLDYLNKEQAKQFLTETEEIKNLGLNEATKLDALLNDLMPNNIITPFKLNIAVNLIANNETEKLRTIMEILKKNPTELVYTELLLKSFDSRLPEKFLIYFSFLNTSFVEKEIFENLIDSEDKNEINTTLKHLQKQSLITGLRKNDDYGYQIHDFIVQTVREKNRDEEILSIIFEKIIEKINNLIDFNFEISYYNKEKENLFKHLDQLLNYYIKHNKRETAANIEDIYWKLFLKYSDYLYAIFSNDFEKQLNYALISLEIFKKIHKDEPYHFDLIKIYNNVSLAYANKGEYEKELEYSLESMKITEYLFESEKISIFNNFVIDQLPASYRSVALAYGKISDYRNQIKYSLKSHEIQQIIYKLKPNHLDLYKSFDCIAKAYANNGEFEKDLKYSKKSLKILKSIHKHDLYHSDLELAYSNIAVSYGNNCEFEKDLEYSLKSLEILEQKYGNDEENKINRNYAEALKNTAVSYRNLGKYKEELELVKKSLSIHEIIYKDFPNHPNLANVYNNIAAAFNSNRDYKKQLEYALKSLDICKKIYKDIPNCFELSTAFKNVASAYESNGKYEEAMKYTIEGFKI
jgi:adenylate kinase family enzyme